MAKATGKNAGAKGEAPKGTQAAVEKLAETSGTELVSVKAGAISADVGPTVIATLAKAYDDEAKANALLNVVKAKRYDMLATLTAGIIKAAKGDDSINLASAFGDDKKAIAKLNNQLGLALGFREIFTVGEGDKAKKSISYAKAVQKFFPGPNDDKKSEAYTQKSTTRSNFIHMLKTCARTAHGVVINKLNVKKEGGTLLLEGPALKETFGTDHVVLNEKLKVNEGGKETTLKARPSFTEIGRMGAAAEGKVIQTRTQSGAAHGVNVDVNVAIQSICNSMVSTLGKVKDKLLPKTIEELKKVQTSIAAKLAA